MTNCRSTLSNRLASEKSPYLLQHRHNPVNWYPWSDEAFAAARTEKKPVFLSIGYSTCYWCHVMEQDSFEREDVAAVLNRDFISIKVDREERPDLDQIYMDAVIALTGHGGWPMSVFLTADAVPFWGGTFFYRAQFLQVLAQIRQAWDGQPERISSSASALAEFLRERGAGAAQSSGSEPGDDVLRVAAANALENFDAEWGGFSGAPKFPPAMQCSLLLKLWLRSRDKALLDAVSVTLTRMAEGGIYDQLGGGFSRYSTDAHWLVPHFEKMLYDNALLIAAYLEAFQATGNDLFARVARESLDYLLRDMRSKDGGFYSAQDAGEVAREGEYYVWEPDELTALLSPAELDALGRIYDLPEGGNFEGKIVLAVKRDAAVPRELDEVRKKLLAARVKRAPPHLDDKVLSGWNGLALSALCKGYQLLGDARYLEAAAQCAGFMKRVMTRDGRLLRRYRDGEAAIPAYLEDYAFVIEGLISLYECSFEPAWLWWAKELQAVLDAEFWDAERGGYYFSTAKDVIVRRKEFLDNATPSGNSTSLLNLLRLRDLFFSPEYHERAARVLGALSPIMRAYPQALPKALCGLNYRSGGSTQVAIIGEGEELLRWMWTTPLADYVVAAAPRKGAAGPVPPLLEGKTAAGGGCTVYLCRDFACREPLTDLAEARRELSQVKPL